MMMDSIFTKLHILVGNSLAYANKQPTGFVVDYDIFDALRSEAASMAKFTINDPLDIYAMVPARKLLDMGRQLPEVFAFGLPVIPHHLIEGIHVMTDVWS
jgi:hypothetical protein